MQITKPLLAGNYDEEKAEFPMGATPKIDGIRFLIIDGVAVSRSFKPLRNEHIQAQLSKLPNGIDGEITTGDTFQDCGAIMRIKGEPEFKVWIFDYVNPSPKCEGKPYNERMVELATLERDTISQLGLNYTVLYPSLVRSHKEVEKLMVENLEQGYEGLILRKPAGKYKTGRSTTKEGILLKVKDFADAEAKVIGFKELMRNENEQKRDVFGLAERSTSKEGMVGADTLGSFIVEMENGAQFSCGSGLTDATRAEYWAKQDELLGTYIKYKYMPIGVDAKTGVPRLPIFLGFRDPDDMS